MTSTTPQQPRTLARWLAGTCKGAWPRLARLAVAGAVLAAFVNSVQPASASAASASVGAALTVNPCSVINTATFTPSCLPPSLLNLTGVYAATPAEAASLQDFEAQAVSNTIKDHGLASTDTGAVLSWGRYDAEAELFALIEQAITTSAASRTTDQQNVVAWVQGVEQNEAEQAAEDAGMEYVKWAGLNQGTYSTLVAENASEGDLQSFLSGAPEPYTDGGSAADPGASADGGYCVYTPPAPYQSQYTSNVYTPPAQSTAPATCFGNGGIASIFSGPPTPSYSQFTSWGEADASYSSQDSTGAVATGAAIAAGLDFGASFVGAGVGGAVLSSGLATALVGSSLQEAILPYATAVEDGVDASVGEAFATSEIAASAGAIASVAIVAITTAVVEGINVAGAAALPGQLATLIVNARTNAPDPASLLSANNGATSLFDLFVGATLPMPLNMTGYNSFPAPAGATYCADPCLNPTPVPAATSSDPQFVVEEKGSVGHATAPSITWEDAALGTAATARLSGNWFVTQPSGGAPVQALSISYTDWAGNEQLAWLVGNASIGYSFVGYNVTVGTSTPLNPSTCLSQGICWTNPSIDYVGSNGSDYAAQVVAASEATGAGAVSGDNPTGSPIYQIAPEGSSSAFYANTFGPLSAFENGGPFPDPMNYTWQFSLPPCNLDCQQTTTSGGPGYTSPIPSTGTTYYSFPTSGTYSVILTATDTLNNQQASDTFSVTVPEVPPTVAVSPDCPAAGCVARTVPIGTTTDLAATISHAGTQDIDNVFVGWGDGTTADAAFCQSTPVLGGGDCSQGTAVPGGLQLQVTPLGSTPPLTLTPNAAKTQIALTDSHTYAKAGIYDATITVSDQSGASVTKTVVEAVTDPVPTVTGVSPTSAPIAATPTLTVKGSGFVAGSTLEWDGAPLATTYVSPTQLTAVLPAADTARATAGQ